LIDEDLDEDILNKKKSLKQILKTIFTISLIIIGVIILSIGNYFGITALFWGGLFIMCMASCLINIRTSPKEPLTQTLSVVRCEKCNYTKVQDFRQGDFVFKITGDCNKCDGALKIQEIYTVKLKKEKT